MINMDLVVKIQDLRLQEGRTYREISESLGVSSKTVSKALNRPVEFVEGYRRKKPAERPAVGKFTGRIEELLRGPEWARQRKGRVRRTSRWVYRQIRKEGYVGAEATVRTYIRQSFKQPQAACPIEHAPAAEVQFDFGQYPVKVSGRVELIHFVGASFPHSTRRFLFPYPKERQVFDELRRAGNEGDQIEGLLLDSERGDAEYVAATASALPLKVLDVYGFGRSKTGILLGGPRSNGRRRLLRKGLPHLLVDDYCGDDHVQLEPWTRGEDGVSKSVSPFEDALSKGNAHGSVELHVGTNRELEVYLFAAESRSYIKSETVVRRRRTDKNAPRLTVLTNDKWARDEAGVRAIACRAMHVIKISSVGQPKRSSQVSPRRRVRFPFPKVLQSLVKLTPASYLQHRSSHQEFVSFWLKAV